VVLVAGDRVHPIGAGHGCLHHRHEPGLVIGGLPDIDGDDDLVTGDRDLDVVALQETLTGGHDPRLWVGGVGDHGRQRLAFTTRGR
jgi:hypothetical protein